MCLFMFGQGGACGSALLGWEPMVCGTARLFERADAFGNPSGEKPVSARRIWFRYRAHVIACVITAAHTFAARGEGYRIQDRPVLWIDGWCNLLSVLDMATCLKWPWLAARAGRVTILL